MSIDAKLFVLYAIYVEYQKDLPDMRRVSAEALGIDEDVFIMAVLKLCNEGYITGAIPKYVDQLGYPVTVDMTRVMPTQKDMRKICKALDCTPTDLYDIRDLDYLGTLEQAPAAKREGRGHPGMVEFRVWLRPTEKKELLEALKQLGYRDAAEWYREMRRNTIARWKRIENGKGGRGKCAAAD